MVTVNFENNEAADLFQLLCDNEEKYKDLHEKVYQAMTASLMNSVNQKIAEEKREGR